MTLFRLPEWSFRPIVLIALLALVSGCTSESHEGRGPEDRPVAVPPMEGQAGFFDDHVMVMVALNGGLGRGNRSREGEPEGEHAGSGGGGGSGGGRRRRGGGGGGMRGSGGEGGGGGDMPSGHFVASNEPAVVLQMRLTNAGNDEVTIEISEFTSALGNFAAQPDTVTLKPGQSAETDPMVSRLGFEGRDLTVNVTLRANGTKETRPIVLHAKSDTGDTASPAP